MRPINPAEFEVMTSAGFMVRDMTDHDPALRRARGDARNRIRRRVRREAIARKHSFLIG